MVSCFYFHPYLGKWFNLTNIFKWVVQPPTIDMFFQQKHQGPQIHTLITRLCFLWGGEWHAWLPGPCPYGEGVFHGDGRFYLFGMHGYRHTCAGPTRPWEARRWRRWGDAAWWLLHVFLLWWYMGVSWNAGTQQPWVFLLKMIILGYLGIPPFKETPILT